VLPNARNTVIVTQKPRPKHDRGEGVSKVMSGRLTYDGRVEWRSVCCRERAFRQTKAQNRIESISTGSAIDSRGAAKEMYILTLDNYYYGK
jgi:hypothetical protein